MEVSRCTPSKLKADRKSSLPTIIPVAVPLDPPSLPPPFPARNMPPPSSPQHAPPSTHLSSAPRGPPIASPFPGVRDLAGSSHHRPEMSISAILGGAGERKPPGSPHSLTAAPSSTPKAMQPPSPGRARSSSMRESGDRGIRPVQRSPRAGVYEQATRMSSEPRRERIFGSPQFRPEPGHGFRAFQAPVQEHVHPTHGRGPPVRPSSQPVADAERFRGLGDVYRDPVHDVRSGGFRFMGEHSSQPPRSETGYRPHERQFERPFERQFDRPAFHNGVTSHPQDRPMFGSPQIDRDRVEGERMDRDRAERERAERDRIDRERSTHAGMRYPPPNGSVPAPGGEDPSAPVRTAFSTTSHPAGGSPRESIEGRAQGMRRQLAHPSPPPGDIPTYDRFRNSQVDRPITLEEHHRMEAIHRDQQRKESEGSVHKQILNISPEFNRRGRNSPLPQAVQGAQPRHIGPGGNNPGVKMEFGRMFSGLGSGVGSSTPNPSHPANGATTPSRNSPAPRHLDNGEQQPDDGRRGARTGSRAGSRAGKKNGRRSRDEIEDHEGRDTPDLQRGGKRAKGNHHHHVHAHHHHHHHHHETIDGNEMQNGMLRHASNPLSHANIGTGQGHHHHRHHAHAHPTGHHHHHHPPRSVPLPRRPSMTVNSKQVLNACADKPRKHVGSQLYTTELCPAPATDMLIDSNVKYSSKMKAIPVFSSYENCTYTVRVPRYYLAEGSSGSHSFLEICHRRHIYGTEIYTDDSDVVAAAVHSGWIKGDFGDWNQDLEQILDEPPEQGLDEEATLDLAKRPSKPVKIPSGHDAHITVLILPPLESYAATNQHHIWSREWKQKHDGMSYMIHSIKFVDEGPSSRFEERGGAARKKRLAAEEAARREAAAGLLIFAKGGGSGTVSVGA